MLPHCLPLSAARPTVRQSVRQSDSPSDSVRRRPTVQQSDRQSNSPTVTKELIHMIVGMQSTDAIEHAYRHARISVKRSSTGTQPALGRVAFCLLQIAYERTLREKIGHSGYSRTLQARSRHSRHKAYTPQTQIGYTIRQYKLCAEGVVPATF